MPVTIALETPRPLQLTGELQRQVPFAISLGMNQALLRAQQAIRQRVMGTFIVRRSQWISQSIKITKFSTKRDLEAVLQVDPTRNVLGKFEPGGTKTSVRPGGSLVVPGPWKHPSAVIPTELRPGAFKFQYAGKGAQATVFRGRDRTFLIRRGARGGAIFQRTGRGANAIRLLYILTSQARIPASLHFRATGMAQFHTHWPREYRAALFRALRTAR